MFDNKLTRMLRRRSTGSYSTSRTGFAGAFENHASGTIIKPLIFDGQGDLIDGGVYLNETHWADEGSNIWATPSNSFIIDGIFNERHAGWYKYSLDGVGLDTSQIRDGFTNGTYLDSLNMTGSERVVPFLVDGAAPTSQGEAVWTTSNNVKMYSVGNPALFYGIICIPNLSIAILNYGNHVRFKNYNFVNIGRDAFRGQGCSDVEVENFQCAYIGGNISTVDGNRAGDSITFNGGSPVDEIQEVHDIRVTGCKVYQSCDIAISMQLFNAEIQQTGNNIEFDNNIVKYAQSGLAFACHTITGPPDTLSNCIMRDNTVSEMGYGWSTYQRHEDGCRYSAYNRGQGLTFNDRDYGSVSGSCFNNTVDHYSGYTPNDAQTIEGVNTWGSTVTISPNTNNTFTNYTGDAQKWIDAGSVCFNPYVDGFPIYL